MMICTIHISASPLLSTDLLQHESWKYEEIVANGDNGMHPEFKKKELWGANIPQVKKKPGNFMIKMGL